MDLLDITFEQYEAKAIECKKELLKIFLAVEKFKRDNNTFVDLGKDKNWYLWKHEQIAMLEKSKNEMQMYLKCWNEGDFETCGVYYVDLMYSNV